MKANFIHSQQEHHTNVVPCGKCIECKRRRQQQWAVRLKNEMKAASTASFLTFTYETTPLSENGLPTLHKPDWQKFMKRLRKQCKNSKLKYYAVGEYGDTFGRPHYHAIMFNLPYNFLVDPKELTNKWTHGMVDIGTCTMASIFYTLGYVMKQTWKPLSPQDDRTPNFAVMSKGLGEKYLTKQMRAWHRYQGNHKNYVAMPDGWKSSMPRVWKEELFSSGELRAIQSKIIEQQQEPEISENLKIQWLKRQEILEQNQIRRAKSKKF